MSNYTGRVEEWVVASSQRGTARAKQNRGWRVGARELFFVVKQSSKRAKKNARLESMLVFLFPRRQVSSNQDAKRAFSESKGEGRIEKTIREAWGVDRAQ